MDSKSKIAKIKELGQFYTDQNIAKQCFLIMKETIPKLITKKKIFIEPSAGTGSFITVVKKYKYQIKGFDIEPKHKDIIKKDFLKEDICNLKQLKANNIIIGNPPFGKRSKGAIEFFNKATEYSNIIGFILPNQFKKYSAQNKLNENFKLIKEIDLEEKAFYIIKNGKQKSYNVNCVFQIRIHKNLDKKNKYENLRIINKPPIKHNDFEMYQYNNTKQSLKIFNNEFDFGVLAQGYGNYNEKITDRHKFSMRKHRVLFKAKNKKVLERLKKMDFEKLSKKNTTTPGFRKADIVKEYERILKKEGSKK